MLWGRLPVRGSKLHSELVDARQLTLPSHGLLEMALKL